MTKLLITWSGLIFPLLAFLAVVAWRFPKTYNQLVGPLFLLLVFLTFLATASWNVGVYSAERAIDKTAEQVAEETPTYQRPSPPYPSDYESEEEWKTALEEFDKAVLEWEQRHSRWNGAQDAIEQAQDTLHNRRLNLLEYYWFLGFFYYALLLAGVRKWLERYEKKLNEPETPQDSDQE